MKKPHLWPNCANIVSSILQELHRPGESPGVNEIDGWNAWYYSDPLTLSQVWSGLGKNQASVFDLWLGFLGYYASDFDDKNLVVCIRKHAPLTKFEKMWNSPCIAIEDPFDLGHNLGAAISRKSEANLGNISSNFLSLTCSSFSSSEHFHQEVISTNP